METQQPPNKKPKLTDHYLDAFGNVDARAARVVGTIRELRLKATLMKAAIERAERAVRDQRREIDRLTRELNKYKSK